MGYVSWVSIYGYVSFWWDMLVFHQPAVCPPKNITWHDFPDFNRFLKNSAPFSWSETLCFGVTTSCGAMLWPPPTVVRLPNICRWWNFQKKHTYTKCPPRFRKNRNFKQKNKKQPQRRVFRVENTFAWETRGAWSKVREDAREEGASKSRRQSNFGTTHVFLGPFF